MSASNREYKKIKVFGFGDAMSQLGKRDPSAVSEFTEAFPSASAVNAVYTGTPTQVQKNIFKNTLVFICDCESFQAGIKNTVELNKISENGIPLYTLEGGEVVSKVRAVTKVAQGFEHHYQQLDLGNGVFAVAIRPSRGLTRAEFAKYSDSLMQRVKAAMGAEHLHLIDSREKPLDYKTSSMVPAPHISHTHQPLVNKPNFTLK